MKQRPKPRKQKKEITPQVPVNAWWKYIIDLTSILILIITTIALIIQYQTKPIPALRPSDLLVQLGTLPLYDDEDIPLFLGINHFDKNAAYIGIFPLVIQNNGQSTARDISVLSKFPKLSRSGLFELLRNKIKGPFRKEIAVKQDFQEIGNFSFHSVNIEHLNPGRNMAIDQPLPLRLTQMAFDVELTKGLKLPVHIEYGLMVEFSIGANNIKSRDYKLTIMIVETEDKDSLSEQALSLIKKIMIEKNKQRPWIERAVSTYVRHIMVGYTIPNLFYAFEGGKVYEVRYNSNDLRMLIVTLPPLWPKYLLWYTLPIIIIIFCYRLGILHVILRTLKNHLK